MSLALIRLLQLASPALPVGAYSYSQGLEWAIEAGTVTDETTAQSWIADQLEWNLGRFEAPLLARMMEAWKTEFQCRLTPASSALSEAAGTKVGAGDTALALNDDYLASRETAELRAETLQMGYSMLRLLNELPDFPAPVVAGIGVSQAPTFPFVWSAVAATWQIPVADALTAYLWSWAENQAMAAIKAVPLGQAAGQRMLLALGKRIAATVEAALTLAAEDYSNFAPGFAIASARHETQYSRLFRS